MKMERLAVSALRPYPKNARTHSRKQIRQIAKSIERFGFCNPVLIDDDNQIIAGHGRADAAKLLKIDEIPTVRLSHLSNDEKRAYILADNRLAEKAGWDREIVLTELQHLTEVGFDLDLTGFEPAEIDLFMDDLSAEDAREDEAPAYGKGPAVSRTGDLWTLGKHMLFCGDARNEASYIRGDPLGGSTGKDTRDPIGDVAEDTRGDPLGDFAHETSNERVGCSRRLALKRLPFPQRQPRLGWLGGKIVLATSKGRLVTCRDAAWRWRFVLTRTRSVKNSKSFMKSYTGRVLVQLAESQVR